MVPKFFVELCGADKCWRFAVYRSAYHYWVAFARKNGRKLNVFWSKEVLKANF